MKYVLIVEETIIHELEVELDTEITNLTSAQKSDLFDKALECGDIVYDNCDYNYELIK